MKILFNLRSSSIPAAIIAFISPIPYFWWEFGFFLLFFFCMSTFYADDHMGTNITGNWSPKAVRIKNTIGQTIAILLMLLVMFCMLMVVCSTLDMKSDPW